MATLLDYCSLIRSKNAGPFVLTFDLICRDEAAYLHLTTSEVLTVETFARLYRIEPQQVRLYHHRPALAIKITIPRPHVQSALEDPDCYGGQQHSPLLDLQV
ncbi:DUF4387 domain-containing protein [Kribbella sp. NPDC055110]